MRYLVDELANIKMSSESHIYKRKLENKLIEEFQLEFYNKIGYIPKIITMADPKYNLPIISLESLIEVFDEIMNEKFGNKKIHGQLYRISSHTRKRDVVEYRYMYFKIAKLMGYYLTDIGRSLTSNKRENGYDHTTVIHGCSTFDNLLDTSEMFSLNYYNVLSLLKSKYEISKN